MLVLRVHSFSLLENSCRLQPDDLEPL